MKVCRILIALFFGTLFQSGYSQETVAIIPQPNEITINEGQFVINDKTSLVLKNIEEKDVSLFVQQFRKVSGFALKRSKSASHNTLSITLDEQLDLPAEGYFLRVSAQGVAIRSNSKTGLFYALQSLRQLLPVSFESNTFRSGITWQVPFVDIKDYPRYGWRGYMKDVSRTFYSVEVVKKYLDVMTLYKLNTFHLHLSDDQGWRIEIKKYPELTSPKTTVFHASHKQPAERSGFFTQEQIKDLVAYAAARHINIVPEIDVPGHCWPIILVKPELGTNQVNQPDYVFPFIDSWGYWGFQFTPNPLDPTKEEVYTFLDDVFTEIVELFPSPYIHFGGDEVVHRLWENEPHIKRFMADHQMSTIGQFQSYFVQRVSEIIVGKGRKPLGWNDILEDTDHLPKETAIMSWLGAGAVKKAAQNQFYTVATPAGPLYFDITQKDRSDGTMADLNYGGANTIQQVYAYDPDQGLLDEEKKYVLGVQANMWPAVPQEVKDINVQNFPRLLALAEVGWTMPNHKKYDVFSQNLTRHYPRLDELKVDYYRDGGYIIGGWSADEIDTAYQVAQWDVTQKVYANGRILAGFFYTHGESFLNVKNVKLLENGIVVSSDDHYSLADKFRGIPFKKNMFFYQLEVGHYKPNAVYTLQAEIAGHSSRDSEGNVTFNMSPFKPFEGVEPR